MTDLVVERAAAVRVARRVAWSTVMPFAVVMAYADGFWMTSLRGAVGAVERSRSPFWSWVRDSTLTLPLFVLAVLGATTVALRVFGTPRLRGRALVTTLLLIVVAGTIVGIGVVIASSTYDYVLQSNQISLMESIHPMCSTGDCAGVQQAASLELQMRSVAYGSGLILLTNLIVVGWVFAIRGGRVDLAKAGSRQEFGVEGSRVEDMRVLLVMLLVGTAVIHATLVASSMIAEPSRALYLSLLIVVDLLVAAAMLMWPRRGPLVAAAVVSGLTCALGLVAFAASFSGGRGTGLPAIIGPAGLATTVLEFGALAVAVVLLRDRAWLRTRGPASSHARGLACVTVMSLIVIGVSGSGLPGLDQFTAPEAPTAVSTHAHSN